MQSCALILSLLLTCLVFSRSHADVGNSRYHSAKCLAFGRRCTAYLQTQSGACRRNVRAMRQSRACYDLACQWCALAGKRRMYPCNTKLVSTVCRRLLRRGKKSVKGGKKSKQGGKKSGKGRTKGGKGGKTGGKGKAKGKARGKAKGKGNNKSGSRVGKGCVRQGRNGKIVVSFGNLKGRDGWTRVYRGGMAGLVFRKERTHGIVSAGKEGRICMKVKADVGGDYYVGMLTAAPHPTENNDCWLSSSKGFRLERGGERRFVGKGVWTKAYQNKGGLKINNVITSVDHRPHVFIVPGVGRGEVVEMCVSGRSYKFEIYKLVMKKCVGGECQSSATRFKLGSLAASRCV